MDETPPEDSSAAKVQAARSVLERLFHGRVAGVPSDFAPYDFISWQDDLNPWIRATVSLYGDRVISLDIMAFWIDWMARFVSSTVVELKDPPHRESVDLVWAAGFAQFSRLMMVAPREWKRRVARGKGEWRFERDETDHEPPSSWEADDPRLEFPYASLMWALREPTAERYHLISLAADYALHPMREAWIMALVHMHHTRELSENEAIQLVHTVLGCDDKAMCAEDAELNRLNQQVEEAFKAIDYDDPARQAETETFWCDVTDEYDARHAVVSARVLRLCDCHDWAALRETDALGWAERVRAGLAERLTRTGALSEERAKEVAAADPFL